MLASDKQTWLAEAECVKQGIPTSDFYLEQYKPVEHVQAAVEVCIGKCPVRAECLQNALDNRERFGYWGGVSERGRRVINKLGITAVEWLAGLDTGIYSQPKVGRPRKR